MSEPFDLVVRGGMLVDGTGAPARPGDIGIRRGQVAELGEVRGSAERTIDATGCAVAPGFVDIHTHYDAQVFWDRMLSISPWHGVTSVVMGNCGFGIAPTRPAHRDLILRTLENVEGMSLDALHAGVGADWPFETFPQYLDAIERRGAAINVGAMVGHTPVRMYVMGEESTERDATDEEVREMAGIVEEAVRAGALGFATSKSPTHVGYAGRPVPSRAASLSEIEALASGLGRLGKGVMQATVGRGFFIQELAGIQRKTGRTVSWTALLTGTMGPDGHRKIMAEHEKLAAQGVRVVPQVSCRPLNFEYQWKAPFPFESMPLFKPVSAADFEGKKRIYADPQFRAAFRAEGGHRLIAGKWEDTVIAVCPTDRSLEERSVAEVARERAMHPVDLVLDLALASNLEARFRVAALNTDEDAVAELLGHPGIVLGLSDAGAHASQLCDACFSTHLLSRFVRERKTLSLEEAVRHLSSRPAEVFGIEGRGRLAPGLAADVVVFDPETVGCSPLRRVHDLPAGADRLVSEARGIRSVIVNGVLIREDGKDCVDPEGPLPGRVLRGGRAS
ncbi:MAG TPA: amidohydrolase [Deltaproteobacteria bacterium]|jgi:N-acyl-D-aspartate/D-glutamate deacylase|nr:amidohydrolase [Deltaproteobacteria bacterium]